MLTPIMIGFDTIYAEKDYNGDGILQYKTSDGTIIDEIQHHFIHNVFTWQFLIK